MTAETYTLRWSKKSNCFHIEPLADTAQKCHTFFLTNSAKADEMRPILLERDEVRRLYDAE